MLRKIEHRIKELGLTAAAAAKLYTGEFDPHIVSQLLENPYFPQLVEKRQNTFNLKQITIDDLMDAIVETVEDARYPADKQDKLREQLTEMLRSCAGISGK